MTEDLKKLYDQATNQPSTATGTVVHVRVNGRSRDIALDLLHVTPGSPDEFVRNAVASFMELSPADLRDTVIERHENGNMTLRPKAVFG
jgi:hypothetical protein